MPCIFLSSLEPHVCNKKEWWSFGVGEEKKNISLKGVVHPQSDFFSIELKSPWREQYIEKISHFGGELLLECQC